MSSRSRSSTGRSSSRSRRSTSRSSRRHSRTRSSATMLGSGYIKPISTELVESIVRKVSRDNSVKEVTLKCITDPSRGVTYAMYKKLEACIFGYVYEGRECVQDPQNPRALRMIPGGAKVAIKMYRLDKIEQAIGRKAENPFQELTIQAELSQWDNPGILELRTCLQTDKHLFAVFPLVKGGDVYKMIANRRKPMKEKYVRKMFQRMIEEVDFCHSKGYCHQDISLENFLLDGKKDDPEPILIDFGQAVKLTQSRSPTAAWEKLPFIGPLGKDFYRAPELFVGSRYNKDKYDGQAVDTWALGISFLIMLTGSPPWHNATHSDDRFRYIEQPGTSFAKLYSEYGFDSISREAMDLATQMLALNPMERPSLREVLSHPFFAQ